MIGEALRDYRKRGKLRLKQLSKKLGMSPSMLSRIEAGERFPGREHITKIAECLGCDIAEVAGVITQAKIIRSWTETNAVGMPKNVDPPYLSYIHIECLAAQQREKFLELANNQK